MLPDQSHTSRLSMLLTYMLTVIWPGHIATVKSIVMQDLVHTPIMHSDDVMTRNALKFYNKSYEFALQDSRGQKCSFINQSSKMSWG